MNDDSYEFFGQPKPDYEKKQAARQERAEDIAKLFAEVFTSHGGKQVMRVLEQRLCHRQPSLEWAASAEEALKRETMRSVFFWIEQVTNDGERIRNL